MNLKGLHAELERTGLLLLTHGSQTSLAGLVAGTPIRGSWWGHPSGGAIFALANELEDDPDVALCKLADGKVSFVHRRLWPALVAVGQSRAEWQIRGLTPASLALLAAVDGERLLHLDALARSSTVPAPDLRKAATLLELRLLAHGRQLHTESGAHSRVLQTWQCWADAMGLAMPGLTAGAGQAQLEAAAAGLGKLPWQAQSARQARSS